MTDEEAMKAVVREVISMYHTTRLDSDPVPHVLSKPSVQRAFAAFAEREAAQAKEIARLEAENERLRAWDAPLTPTAVAYPVAAAALKGSDQ